MIKITFTAVLHLYCSLDPLINTDKKGKLKEEKPWNTALKMMNKPAAFLAQLNEFKGYVDTDKVPAQNFDAIRETLAMENFTPEVLNKASQAARGVCDWIINITKYYDVVVSVEPKKKTFGNHRTANLQSLIQILKVKIFPKLPIYCKSN